MRNVAYVIWLFILYLPVITWAQEKDYHTIYRIQITITEEPDSFNFVPDLNHLGFVRLYPLERGPMEEKSPVRVMLGPYLGANTADFVLQKVWKKGYTEAQLIKDDFSLLNGEGTGLTHTIQVGAFKKPYLNKYNDISTIPAHGMFIVYEEGLFKIFSGLYTSQEESYLRNSVLPYFREEYGLYGFIRKLR